jgi:hypothetical protein
MDPVSLIATASAAYNAIKKGIEIGRELHDMGSQLSTWASCLSDLDFIEQKGQKHRLGIKRFRNQRSKKQLIYSPQNTKRSKCVMTCALISVSHMAQTNGRNC